MKTNRTALILLMLMAVLTAGAQKFAVENLKEGIGTLKNNTRYIVNRDITIDATNHYGEAALSVADKATAILELQKGCTLTLKGCDFHGNKVVATPGLRIKAGSKLVICGEGTLHAIGGKGGGAQDGSNGARAQVDTKAKTEWYRAGHGGAGGHGASGSAPGIGTDGGMGGDGGAPTDSIQKDEHKAGSPDGLKGHDGQDGFAADAMGTLIVLEHVKIIAERGGREPFTVTQAYGGKDTRTDYNVWKDYQCGGGGGGGQGGECNLAPFSIGAGGPGSGGGGSGGSGGLDQEFYKRNLINKPGQGGFGGKAGEGSRNGGDGKSYSNENPTRGGQPGLGGKAAQKADNGKIYVALTAELLKPTVVDTTFDVDVALLPQEMRFRMQGGKDENGKDIEFYTGMLLPKKIQIPQKPTPTSVFHGFCDQYEVMLYNSNGEINAEIKDTQRFFIPDAGNKDVFVMMAEDIVLTPKFTDQVYIKVNHQVAEPGSSEKPLYNTKRYLTSNRVYTMGVETIPASYTLKAGYNADGTLNDALDIQNTAKYYCIEADEVNIVVDTKIKKEYAATFHYGRVLHDLTYDLGSMSEEEFNSRLVNKDTYTKADDVEYGAMIERPVLRQKGGWALKQWSPADVTYMPEYDLTLKLEMEQVKFNVHIDSIDAGDTHADMKLSRYNEISYEDTVWVNCTIGNDAHVMSLAVKRCENGEAVELKAVNDSTFYFIMPDDNVNLGIAFDRIRYGVTAAASNISGTIIAVTDGNGLVYTDNRIYYELPDSVYGGELKDFPLYSHEKLYVDAEIVNADIREHAQATLLFNDGNTMDFTRAHQVLLNVGDRVLPFYEFQLDKVQDLQIEVLWKLQTPKTISFMQKDGSVKVTDVFVNGKSTFDSKYNGATACMGDLVAMELETEDKDFDAGNICVSYLSAEGHWFYVPVKDYVDRASGKEYYVFFMPSQHAKVTLSVGYKENVTVQEPFTDHTLCVAPKAVRGSKVPFFILDAENTYSPVVKTMTGEGVDLLDYGMTLYRHGSNVDVLTSAAFMMPDGGVNIGGSDSNEAKVLPFISEELRQATGIDAPVAPGAKAAPMYNIMGTKVTDGYKGIVILNGRKYVR